MLYSAFCKIKIEAERLAGGGAEVPDLITDSTTFSSKSVTTVGSLFTLTTKIEFFTKERVKNN